MWVFSINACLLYLFDYPWGVTVSGSRERGAAVLPALQIADLSLSTFWSSFQTVSFSSVLYLSSSSRLKQRSLRFSTARWQFWTRRWQGSYYSPFASDWNKESVCLLCPNYCQPAVSELDVCGFKHGAVLVAAGEVPLCGKHQCRYTSKT